MKILYIIRGLPGAGKSTLARKLTPFSFEADDFFLDEFGVYKFDKEKLREAHEWCRSKVRISMLCGDDTIAVSNTFTRRWEISPYLDLAFEFRYDVIEVIVKSDFNNIHNVPAETIEAMRERWED